MTNRISLLLRLMKIQGLKNSMWYPGQGKKLAITWTRWRNTKCFCRVTFGTVGISAAFFSWPITKQYAYRSEGEDSPVAKVLVVSERPGSVPWAFRASQGKSSLLPHPCAPVDGDGKMLTCCRWDHTNPRRTASPFCCLLDVLSKDHNSLRVAAWRFMPRSVNSSKLVQRRRLSLVCPFSTWELLSTLWCI